MNSTCDSAEKPMQFRSLFWGLWLGPFAGTIGLEFLSLVLYTTPFDLHRALRSIGVVYLCSAAIGYPLILSLVRLNKLTFIGFTCAGVIAGALVSLLWMFVGDLLNWNRAPAHVWLVLALGGAILVAWATWAVGRLAEFAHRPGDD